MAKPRRKPIQIYRHLPKPEEPFQEPERKYPASRPGWSIIEGGVMRDKPREEVGDWLKDAFDLQD